MKFSLLTVFLLIFFSSCSSSSVDETKKKETVSLPDGIDNDEVEPESESNIDDEDDAIFEVEEDDEQESDDEQRIKQKQSESEDEAETADDDSQETGDDESDEADEDSEEESEDPEEEVADVDDDENGGVVVKEVSETKKKGKYTPTVHGLIKSARVGTPEMCRYYLKRGVDINAQNKRGETALHAALHAKRYDIARFLLRNKARVDIPDAKGERALELIYKVENNKSMIDIIESRPNKE